jgi:hypothetical protein
MDNQLAGIVWAFTRLALHVEAVIGVIEQQVPDVRQRIVQEVDRLRAQHEIARLGTEYRQEIERVNDWAWLREHGIDPSNS